MGQLLDKNYSLNTKALALTEGSPNTSFWFGKYLLTTYTCSNRHFIGFEVELRSDLQKLCTRLLKNFFSYEKILVIYTIIALQRFIKKVILKNKITHMKKIIQKSKKVIQKISIISTVILLISIASCKSGGEDPLPDPTPTNTDEMYIILNGKKIICKLPAKQYEVYSTILDTGVQWSGNLPSSDTTIGIGHYGPRIAGFKYTLNPKAVAPDIVTTVIRWSYISTAPHVIVDGGNYTLEKIKGKWVSTLKNGTGYDYNTKTKRYTNIEYRIIWP